MNLRLNSHSILPEIIPPTAAALAVICLLVSGCSLPKNAAATRRFHDASRTDVVLQFSSWDYTFLVQPRYEEGGFLRQVRRDTIGHILDGFQVRRDLAVVVIGWTYEQQDLNRLVAEWKSVLGGCGFRRVAFLRSNAYNQLNGSLIIDDSTLSIATAQAGRPFREASR